MKTKKKTYASAIKILLCASLACILALSPLALTSCENESMSISDKFAAGETIKIGIIQLSPNPSLDNCRRGIMAALEGSGLNIDCDLQVGSPNSAESDCATFAGKMVADGTDMIIAIATPAARSAFTAAADTGIPVIFCAVSDPVGAGLAKSWEAPGYNATGTSDVLDMELHLDMILTLQPEVKTIGVIYTSSEENSLTQLKALRAACDGRGVTVNATAVQGAADIPAAAATVAKSSDCILNFTDNNVVQSLSVLLSAADGEGIPVYGSEIEQVKNGCAASMSIDYEALGRLTGEQAADVIRGADPATSAIKKLSAASPVLNTATLASLGITIPDAYASAERVD